MVDCQGFIDLKDTEEAMHRWFWLLLGILVLSACGTETTVAPPATPVPTSPAQPTPVSGSPFANIAKGKTPEGYQMLGDPNAPLTMVMYSDFL